MRIEATIADPRAEQLSQLADQLHVSKSQLIEEALAVFLKAVLEAKLGRRLAFIDPTSRQAVCEVASPSLTQLEWTAHQASIQVTSEAMEQVARLVTKPPAPTAKLKRAMARRRP
jgi:hypothetical protein